MNDKEPQIHTELAAIREAGRWRTVGATTHDLTNAICFSSNDYLALSHDPRVIAAAQNALQTHGTSSGASRLMAGQTPIHAALETALAAIFDTESALVFPSGYQANIGILSALANRDTTIFSDALNHASLIDGARLSRANVQVYPHNDTTALEAMLSSTEGTRRKIIVTESIFSMDGDRAPITTLADLAARHDAWLVVDEAHAIGLLGQGRGLCASHNVKPDILLGTLSKSLGSQGGFVACSTAIRDLLVNKARTFIFSTGLAPSCAAAALAALEIIRDEPEIGAEVLRKAHLLRDALRAGGLNVSGDTQIIPVLLGGESIAMAAAAGCRARGVLAHGIRPPTVPPGQCRLRLSVTRAHDDAALLTAAAKIIDAVREAQQ